jgi:cyclophilin family peptidyl-prolyl cis-trans isomerase
MTNKYFGAFLLLIAGMFFQSNLHAQVKNEKKVSSNKSTATMGDIPDKSYRVKITTDSGVIVVKLSDSTPLHRDNFAKLVREGFFDSLLFHRVIPGFMIQGGDPTSKRAASGTMLGNGGGDLERIPAEFNPALIHKKGALSAARDGNPEKKSSACQFFLVEGKLFDDAQLDMLEKAKGRKYTQAQRDLYKTVGGTPHLDMEYTVFGEVVSGLDVISKISALPRDAMNRPLKDIRMRMELIASMDHK